MKVRSCTENDVEYLYKMNHKIYGDNSYPYFVLRQYFDCFGSLIKLAKEKDKFIGFAINGMNNNKKIGWILSVGVDKDYRKKGIGTRLLEESIEDFKKKGISKIKLTVSPNNDAIKLYKKNSFKEIMRLKNYLGNGEVKLIMELDIE